MCGRARCSLAREAVVTASGVPVQRWRDQDKYRPTYNISPGAWIPVIKLGADGSRELQTMKWGLVPSFTQLGPGEHPDHYRMFNARSESLTQKPVFSRLLPSKRCVVLLDGFYEWHNQGGGGGAASRKQPYHITTAEAPQQPAMYLAGLYDVFQVSAGEQLHTFTIITTDSSTALAWLHDRMPVILTSPEEVAAWLGEGHCEGKAETKGAAAPKVEEEASRRGSGAAGEAPSSPVPPGTTSPAESTEAADDGCGLKPSTPGSHLRVAPRSLTESAAAATGSAAATALPESKSSRDCAADAIDIVDSGDFGDPGGGGGDSGGEDRSSQGKLGASQVGRQGAAARRGRGVKGTPHSDAAKERCEALVEQICRPYGGPLLRWHPVTPDMSKPGYDKPDCCKDVRTKKGSIASFFKPAAKGGAATPPTVKKEEPPRWKQLQTSQQHAGLGATVEEEKKGEGESEAAAAAVARNTDECRGADGSGGVGASGGLKRPANWEGGDGDGAAARKR